MASFPGRCWPLVDLCQVVSDWKAQRFSWPKGKSRESVESMYMKFMGTTFLSEELDRLKNKKKNMSSESSRFSYRVFTGLFSHLKHANS